LAAKILFLQATRILSLWATRVLIFMVVLIDPLWEVKIIFLLSAALVLVSVAILLVT
jgi:hypothetical protein